VAHQALPFFKGEDGGEGRRVGGVEQHLVRVEAHFEFQSLARLG
jgi:hypothetical protein